MEIMLAHPLVLPDEALGLAALAAAVHAWGLAVQRRALAEAWARRGEKAVGIVVNRRCKGKRGMNWWREWADGVVALRLAQLNGEWDQRLPTALAA